MYSYNCEINSLLHQPVQICLSLKALTMNVCTKALHIAHEKILRITFKLHGLPRNLNDMNYGPFFSYFLQKTRFPNNNSSL